MPSLGRLVRFWGLCALLSNASADRYPDCISGPLSSNDVCNPELDPTDRAKALVAAMTIQEKLANFVECVPLFTVHCLFQVTKLTRSLQSQSRRIKNRTA